MSSDALLLLSADLVDDLERTRIATDNRLRSLAAFGLAGTPEYVALTDVARGVAELEHAATLSLQRIMRRHPLADWVTTTRGAGMKSTARLLAVIGDPYWNTLHDRPRTVSELWAFCGLHVLPGAEEDPKAAGSHLDRRCVDAHTTFEEVVPGVAARRRKGRRANWSTKAKTRAYLLAESCMKQLDAACRDDLGVTHRDACKCSGYRLVYDDRRAHTVQTRPDWTPAHRHTDAVRIAAKAILRDLWCEAKAHAMPADETVEAA